MSGNEPTLEAEVVEIDGVAVDPKTMREKSAGRPKGPQRAPWAQWGTWQGQMKRLDARWWPLWVVLGFIVLVLVVAVGMVALVCYVTWRVTLGLLNALLSVFLPSSTELQRR